MPLTVFCLIQIMAFNMDLKSEILSDFYRRLFYYYFIGQMSCTGKDSNTCVRNHLKVSVTICQLYKSCISGHVCYWNLIYLPVKVLRL